MAAAWQLWIGAGRAALVCALALNAAGCSTVADLSGVPRPGYQKDGSYVLSAHEHDLGCRELQARQVSLQTQLQELPMKAVQQMQELPQTVADAWSRLTGSPDQGVPAIAQYNEAKAEADAVNASIQQKGCGTSMETAGIRSN